MKWTKENLEAFIKGIVKEATGASLEEHKAETQRRQVEMIDTFKAMATNGRTADEGSREKGILATAFIKCMAAASYFARSGQPFNREQYAKENYGDNVAKALSASIATEGGILVPEQVASDIIPLLRPASVFYGLGPRIVSMPSGVYSHPRLTGGAAAGYVGENQNVPKTEATTGALRMTAKKLAALVPVSNDWLRRSIPGSDGTMRDDLIAAVSQKTDVTFIRSAGGVFSPTGLRYLVKAANTFAANATINLANVTNDLGQLVLRLANANVPMTRPGFIVAPRTWNYLMTVRDANGNFAFREELMQGRLWGWPVKMTTQIPVNLGGGTDESEIYLADFAEIFVGETTQLLLDTSSEAAYHDGSAVQAAFSLDQTVIRVIVEHDLAMRQPDAVAVMTAVKWS